MNGVRAALVRGPVLIQTQLVPPPCFLGHSSRARTCMRRVQQAVLVSLDGGRLNEVSRVHRNTTAHTHDDVLAFHDAVIDDGLIHLFCPHLWNRALHLTIREDELGNLPTAKQLAGLVDAQ